MQGFRHPVIAHDWITIPGGSEKVVEAILRVLPTAEIYTSVYDRAQWTESPIGQRPVHASFLQRVPGSGTRYPRLLPLMPRAFRSFDLTGADLVVSSSHAASKNIRAPDGVPHLCYCHTPMRYAWEPDFLDGERLGRGATLGLRALLPKIRRDDLRGARGVTHFLANSTAVAERIQRFYGRDADVLHPPVAVERFLEIPRAAADDAPFLFFGRVVPYKRADLAVEACSRLNLPLRVAGTGRDLARVQALAGPNVEFLGHVSDAEAAELMATSRALLFPGIEDFGIVPVEAQAAGLPVIGRNVGGLRDTVIHGQSGILYDGPSVDELMAAIRDFERADLDEPAIRHNSIRFSEDRFDTAFADVLASL